MRILLHVLGLLITKKPDYQILMIVRLFEVVWAGIEPATQGFSVLCSTD